MAPFAPDADEETFMWGDSYPFMPKRPADFDWKKENPKLACGILIESYKRPGVQALRRALKYEEKQIRPAVEFWIKVYHLITARSE